MVQLKKYKSDRFFVGRVKDPVTGKIKEIKRIITVTANSKREADILIAKEKLRIKEEFTRNRDSSLSSIVTMNDLYVKYHSDLMFKPTSLSTDQNIWEPLNPRTDNVGLKSYWGNKKIVDVTAEQVREYLEEVQRKGWGEVKIHNAFRALRKYLRYAVEQGVIPSDPLVKLKRASFFKAPEPKKTISGEELIQNIKKFYSKIFKQKDTSAVLELKVKLLLTADGALRSAELFGLTTDAIDLDEGYINIEQNCYKISKREAEEFGVNAIGVTSTKTKGSTRKLPLSKITVEYLRKYLADCENYIEKNNLSNTHRYLFFSRRNLPDRTQYNKVRKKGCKVYDVLPEDKDNLNGSLRRWCRKLNIPVFSAHKIRKWSNTVRLNNDVPEQYSKYVLGHSMAKVDAVYVLGNLYGGAKKYHGCFEEALNCAIKTTTH